MRLCVDLLIFGIKTEGPEGWCGRHETTHQPGGGSRRGQRSPEAQRLRLVPTQWSQVLESSRTPIFFSSQWKYL